MAQKGTVFDIKRTAINDGFGIRTTVFLKGCNLNCGWCHNPESINSKPELLFNEDKCLGCRACMNVCKQGVHEFQNGKHILNREKCVFCGSCVEACPSDALQLCGEEMTVEDVMNIVDRDKLYYDQSGGGITLSGGDPLCQFEFTRSLLWAAKGRGIHTILDTNGNSSWAKIEALLPFLDGIRFDLKHMDSNKHKKYTGSGNNLILDNFKKIADSEVSCTAVIPVIPGVNDSTEDIDAFISFLKPYSDNITVNLLTYHNLHSEKLRQLSIPLNNYGVLSDNLITDLTANFESNGIIVTEPSAPFEPGLDSAHSPEIEYLADPPERAERIQILWERRKKIDDAKGRTIYSVAADLALGQATSGPAACSREGLGKPELAGEASGGKFVALGDQAAFVRVKEPFPGKLPSQENGIEYNPLSIMEDYAVLLDYSPAEVYPYENIVGEYHWELSDLRPRIFPEAEELDTISAEAAALGAGGYPVTHTCADVSIGIESGWGKILERIESALKNKELVSNKDKLCFLKGEKTACEAIIKYIEKHSVKAADLEAGETDPEQRKRYGAVKEICSNIAYKAPESFHEGVQWLWFYMMVERMNAGGNGYGRLDQYLFPLYEKDLKSGKLTRNEARNLLAELFLKYGTFYAIGGRNEQGQDAVNDLSWLCLEAYDMVGGMMMLGAMWHNDIDRSFIKYASAIMGRHGNGSVSLVNQDILRDSQIYYGVPPKDAWNATYSGCFWYTIPGKEWCTHDSQSISGIKCFMNALDEAFETGIENILELWTLYDKHIDLGVQAIKRQTDWQFKRIPDVWPEMITSLMAHGCIENGRDITDCGVPYNSTVVQFSGLANITDSFTAIEKIVFEEKRCDLKTLQKALQADFKGYEELRQLLLNCPKYGDDDDEINATVDKVAEQYRYHLSNYQNGRGFCFRPAFFSWAGHAFASTIIGATPDGRKKNQPIGQGANPSHQHGSKGLTAVANSVSVLDFPRNAGGQLQVELDPSFQDMYDPANVFSGFANSYFLKTGQLILMNMVSTETLKKALKSPEDYGHIIVRVTGFSAHFVTLDKKLQEEIIERTRHAIEY